MTTRLIGLDWATEEPKRGIAAMDAESDELSPVYVGRASKKEPALAIVSRLLDIQLPTIISIDAPLGWPAGLSIALTGHTAGTPIDHSAAEIFSRRTDRFVRDTIRKIPMEVGANMIARVAHSAVNFLGELRRRTGKPIPMLWHADELQDVGAIEVYPASTRIVSRGEDPAEELRVQLSSDVYQNEHVRDALWCVVAARDFFRGECYPPEDVESARCEGWIWFRRRIV